MLAVCAFLMAAAVVLLAVESMVYSRNRFKDMWALALAGNTAVSVTKDRLNTIKSSAAVIEHLARWNEESAKGLVGDVPIEVVMQDIRESLHKMEVMAQHIQRVADGNAPMQVVAPELARKE